MMQRKTKKPLSESDKNKILIIFCAILAAGYIGVWYPQTSEEITFQENMINRRLDRIKNRVANIPEPAAAPVNLKRTLAALDESLVERRGRLLELEARFASLETPEELQALRLEVSRLAQESKVLIERMGGFAPSSSQETGVTSAEALARSASNRFGRPLMELRARADFGGLMRFLQRLGDLRHNVSVVRLGLKLAEPEPKSAPKSKPGAPVLPLEIDLLLAL